MLWYKALCVPCNWRHRSRCVLNEAHNTVNADDRVSDTFSVQSDLKHQKAYDHCFSILIHGVLLGIRKNADRA